MSEATNPIDVAMWLNKHYGLPIIPLAPHSKRPLESGWPDKGRSGSEILDMDRGNYGVLLNGVTVVDFDPRNMDLADPEDESEVEYLIHLLRKAHGLHDTLEVVTGGGGLHLYYAGESRQGKLANGVDINCLLYTSPSPRDATLSRMPSSA